MERSAQTLVYSVETNRCGDDECEAVVRCDGVAWSGDGKRLAYNSFGELRIVGVDGSNDTLPRRASGDEVTWSRHGQLAWTGRSTGRLFVTDRSRRRVRQVKNARLADMPRWSRDGRRLTFKAGRADLVQIIRPDGRGKRTVTGCCDDLDRGVAWSPGAIKVLCANQGGDLLLVDMSSGRAKVNCLRRVPRARPSPW